MKIVVFAALSALLLAGCATVTRGTTDAFTVNTDPSGAAVRTTNQYACDETPCTFKMPRKSEFEVTITKKGYKTWQGHVTHKIATAGGAGMAGNVLVGGLIGVAVDSTSGAMMDLVPNPLTVKLEVEAPVVAAAETPVSAATPAQAQSPALKAFEPEVGDRRKAAPKKTCAISSPTNPSSVTC